MREEQWQFLLDLQQSHSINSTSRKFNISPQALGKSLYALEKEVGLPLLNRSHVGVSLTKEGETFLRLSTAFYGQLQELRENYQGVQEQATKLPLELWSSTSAIEQEIGQLILEYDELFPGLKVHIRESNFGSIIKQLINKEIDFGLCALVLIDGNMINLGVLPDEVQFLPIRSDKIMACCSTKSPLAAYNSISIKTLMQYPMLARIYNGGINNSAIAVLKYFNWEGEYVLESNKEVFFSKLATGKYVSLEKNEIANEYSGAMTKLLKRIPLREDIQIQTGYVMRKDESLMTDSIPVRHLKYLHSKADK